MKVVEVGLNQRWSEYYVEVFDNALVNIFMPLGVLIDVSGGVAQFLCDLIRSICNHAANTIGSEPSDACSQSL